MAAGRLVAVLEDDESAADALSLLLADWGAEVIVAQSADEVITRLGPATSDLDYVISDFNIEGFPDGVEASRALVAAAPNARVLILTGSLRRSGEAVASAAGFDLMFKPARAEHIIAWLERA